MLKVSKLGPIPSISLNDFGGTSILFDQKAAVASCNRRMARIR